MKPVSSGDNEACLLSGFWRLPPAGGWHGLIALAMSKKPEASQAPAGVPRMSAEDMLCCHRERVAKSNVNRYYTPMSSRRRRYRYKPKPQPKRPPANDEIRADEVRLIGADGAQLGVVSTEDARERAATAGADLVVVAQKANPPVVRMMNLGKYMYEQRKKDAKQKVKSKGGDIKGIRIGFKTGEQDWKVRLQQTAKFLAAGNKVKVEVRLRGRERQKADLVQKRVEQFVAEVPGGASQEGPISRSGNSLSVMLTAPKK